MTDGKPPASPGDARPGEASPANAGAAKAGTAPQGSGEFVPVLPADALRPGEARRIQLAGRLIALWNLGDTILATDDTCTHERASLSEGSLDVEAAQVECPRHGARFDLRTGRALTLPAYRALRTYPVRVQDGQIEIRLG